MQHFNHLQFLSPLIKVKALLLVVLSLMFTFVMFVLSSNTSYAYASAKTENTALAERSEINKDTWQIYLQAPKQVLWQGQSSQWLVFSLNPPSSKAIFDLPSSDDFSLLNSAPIVVNENGQTGWAYPVNVTPNKAGTLTIPAFTLTFPNQTLATKKQIVNVNAAKSTNRIELQISTNQDEIFVGQSIRLTTSLTLDYPVAALVAVNLHLPILLNEDITVVQPWNKADENNNKSIGLPVNGQRQIAHWQSLADNKVRIHFQSVLKSNVAGQYTLAPAALFASVIDKLLLKEKKKFKGTQYVAYYNNNFFDSVDDSQPSHRIVVKSSELTLNVKALPSNAPKHFSGIVGRPIIEVSAEPKSVKQGEPINYAINIIHPDIETLTLPLLSEMPSFTQSFNLPGDASILTTDTGSKTINQSLFPRRADIQAIPALSLNYFEPKTGMYRDLEINSVPIQVTENTSFNFSDIEANDNVSLKNSITIDQQGIWALRWQKAEADVKNSYSNAKTLLSQTWFILFLLALPPVVAAVMMLKTMQNRLHQRRATHPAYQLKLALSKGSDSLLHLSRYCYQRFALAPSQFDANNVKQCLALLFTNAKQYNDNSALLTEELTTWIANYQLRYGENLAAHSQQENEQLVRIIDDLESILPRYQEENVGTNVDPKTPLAQRSSAVNTILLVTVVSGLFLSTYNNQAFAIERSIEDLHNDHQQALQLDIDSPHKGNLAHAKIAQQLISFIGDQSLDQSSLMYDIGTSWFQAGRYGESILWLRRAENLAPDDDIILHNLSQARLKRLDQLPDNFAPPWLSQLHSMTSHPFWLIICWFTYCLVWLLVWRRYTQTSFNNKHLHFALIFLSIAIFSQIARYQLKPEQSAAVVTSQEVTSRKGPGLIFSPAFTTPLHAGAELVVLKTDGQWSKVKLTNGEHCWLPSRALSTI